MRWLHYSDAQASVQMQKRKMLENPTWNILLNFVKLLKDLYDKFLVKQDMCANAN